VAAVAESDPDRPDTGEQQASGPVSSAPESVQAQARLGSGGRRSVGLPSGAAWLILCCYLAGAIAVTGHLWADPAGRLQVGDPHDVDLFAWYMRYAATAVSHGRLPALVTTALNPPQGVNLMWNTSFLLPGTVLAPVTLLAGPQVSLTVVLTLSLAGSAAALFFVLRRWEASIPAAALGGAVYGFSPAMINSGIGHYHLVFAVLPPLMIHALLRLLTGRGRAVWNGVWLGVLVGAQVFIGEEMLVYTAIACLILTVAVALQWPRAAIGRAGPTVLGLAVAGVVALVISGRALWVQFHGPLTERGAAEFFWSTNLSFFVSPTGNVLFHTSASAAAAQDTHLGTPEVLAYLGWPLLAVLAVAIVWFWRDARVRTAGIAFLVLELFSLGAGSQPFISGKVLPWHWLAGLPGLSSVLPDRFALLADGAAAAVLAFSLDCARAAVRARTVDGTQDPARARTLDGTQDSERARALDGAGASVRARGRGVAWIPAAVAVLAVVPLIPLPYQTALATPVPAGWRAAFTTLRLEPDARVLVVPIPNVGHTEAMRWQADTGEPGSMIGGYYLGPAPGTRQAMFDPMPARSTAHYLDKIWAGVRPLNTAAVASIRAALAVWRPAAVVAVTSAGSPTGRVLIKLLGKPGYRGGGVLAWRR
jgi:hypothetical protein